MNKRFVSKTYTELVEFTKQASKKLSVLDRDKNSKEYDTEVKALVEELIVACEELETQSEELISSNELILDQRSNYKSLFDKSPTPYITTTKASVITSANTAASKLFGVEAQFLESKPLNVYVVAEHRSRMHSLVDNLNNGRTQAVEWESEIQPRGKATIAVIVNVCATGDCNEMLLWTFQDISQRLAQEKAMKYDQIDDFIAALIHDLRVPVVGSQMVLNHLIDTCHSDDKSNLQVLDRANQHLLANINSLLDVYELKDAPRDETMARRNLAILDVAQLIDSVTSAMQSHLLDETVELSASVPEGTIVEACEVDMHRLLTCLVHNAIKHSLDKGVVQITVSEKNNEIILEVKDQGNGIAKENLTNLFKRFWTGQSKIHPSSTGLGLYYCAKLVDLYQGKIECQSELSKGTTFTVTLPKTQARQLSII